MKENIKQTNFYYTFLINRSPGGNPIRHPLTPTSSSNVLAAVLRMCFAAEQSVTPKPDYRDTVNNSCKSHNGSPFRATGDNQR